jgi:hypothetical protein
VLEAVEYLLVEELDEDPKYQFDLVSSSNEGFGSGRVLKSSLKLSNNFLNNFPPKY